MAGNCFIYHVSVIVKFKSIRKIETRKIKTKMHCNSEIQPENAGIPNDRDICVFRIRFENQSFASNISHEFCPESPNIIIWQIQPILQIPVK
ncbi:hypothetical protein C5L28_001320 [Lentilactobacillus parakefiri]|uniref:Uncharacterized protein n=1 Tax=Lentilactobacillus parakefiri TaxID=152332 RepID=A0A224VDQ4_9LACO|nr:hypothetical protein C5L28_001320 [Lentilactobacillus parakefiri]GAW71193.1 hypothetical protein LPKJCM_00265 [Lentilactobacillus parakefiri]